MNGSGDRTVPVRVDPAGPLRQISCFRSRGAVRRPPGLRCQDRRGDLHHRRRHPLDRLHRARRRGARSHARRRDDKLDISSRVSGIRGRAAPGSTRDDGNAGRDSTLKAAFDTYHTEARLGTTSDRRLEAQQTVTRELEKLAAVTSASVLAILDDRQPRVRQRGKRPAAVGGERAGHAVGARIHDVSDGGRGSRRGIPRVGCSTATRRSRRRHAGAWHEPRQRLRRDPRRPLARGHRDHRQRRSRRTRTVPENVTRDLVANEENFTRRPN